MSRVATRAEVTARERARRREWDAWIRTNPRRRGTRGWRTRRFLLQEEEAGLARLSRRRSPHRERAWLSWTLRRRRAVRLPLRFRKLHPERPSLSRAICTTSPDCGKPWKQPGKN